MKRKNLFYFIMLFFSLSVFSQVGINDAGTDDFDTTPINSNAVLELRSNNKGLLLPRVNAETAALQVEGMLFYNTTGKCFKAWDGTKFQVLGSPCVVPNTPPTATVNNFTANFKVGTAATGTYIYSDAENDAESGTTFQWKLANDNTGAGATDIAGATTVSYTPVATDQAKFLSFCVTPNDGKDAGTQVCSNYMVVDAAALPTLSIADPAAVTEGQNQIFTVTLSAAATTVVTVNYATADGTAVQPGDYTTASGTLTFATGETSKTITVTTIDDAVAESTENYTITLSNPNGATILRATATAEILDNDTAPTTTYTEDFESRNLTNSYGNNNFTGADNTSWAATVSRNDAGFVIGGTKSLMLRRNSDSSLEITFPNGVNKISLKYRKAYTGTGNRRLKVSKKVGTVVTDLFTSQVFGGARGRDDTIHSTGDIIVGETGNVTLIVKPDTARQLCVDDFSWTK